MDDEIPSVDIRVRVRLLEWKRLPELQDALNDFLQTTGIEIIENDSHLWLKAMLLVQNPKAFDSRDENQGLRLTTLEKEMLDLDREPTKSGPKDGRRLPSFERNSFARWRHLPWEHWKIMVNCALAAITQGCSEVVVNAAQQWYQVAFHIFIDYTELGPSINDHYPGRPGIFGLINGAPYLCCVFSIWLTPWLNRKLGRRGTIFWSSVFSILSPILQAISRTWWELFIFRLLMGVGIGPKSATIPIYIAEVAPASIRGSLVMFWQVFTALGIMLGSVAGVALQRVGDATDTTKCPLNDTQKLLSQSCSLNWRLILAVPFVPAFFLFLYIYSCHESPRWLVAKAHSLRDTRRPETARVHYRKAYKALGELSRHRLLAARDMLSHYYLLDEEAHDLSVRQDSYPRRLWINHKFGELFGRRRNRRAIFASSLVMFAQQFCGVNLIVYYSDYAFARILLGTSKPNLGDIIAGPPDRRLDFDQKVLLYTMGFGLINFFFASPAFFMIDTVGRRTLLLCTLPLLCLSNLITSIAFAPDNYHTGPAIALTGMYLFGIFYSFGLGPIPFVYASESVPLYCREVAVALVVSINWLFNWLLAFTGPLMFESFKPAGTFGFYCAFCAILTIMVLFLVPETRLLKLEEIDFIFDEVRASDFGGHAKDTLLWQMHLGKEPDRLYKSAEERILGARQPPNEEETREGRPEEVTETTSTPKNETDVQERVASRPHQTTAGMSPRSDRTLIE